MKKIILLGSFIAFGLSTQAQLTLGLKGGSALSDWNASSDTSEIDIISKYGRNFAFALEYQVIERLSVRIEPGWSGRGATIHQEGSAWIDGIQYEGYYREEYDINYFDIPLMAQLNLGDGPLRLRFLAGYNFSYATGGEVKEIFNIDPPIAGVSNFENTENLNFEDRDWNTGDNAVIIGGGLNFFFGRHVGLRLDARYFIGQSDLFLDEVREAYNRTWMLNIGLEYRFEFY